MNTNETLTTTPETQTWPEHEPPLRPAIWVASLLDHEYQIQHGAWIAADQPLNGIRKGIDDMLAASPIAQHTGATADRWQIFRQRGFGDYRISAWEGLQRISDIATGLATHGRPFAAWAKLATPEQLSEFDSSYLGHFDDLHTFVEQLINDLAYDRILDEAVPDSIRPYVKINIDATGADLILGGDLRTAPATSGGIWIFRG